MDGESHSDTAGLHIEIKHIRGGMPLWKNKRIIANHSETHFGLPCLLPFPLRNSRPWQFVGSMPPRVGATLPVQHWCPLVPQWSRPGHVGHLNSSQSMPFPLKPSDPIKSRDFRKFLFLWTRLILMAGHQSFRGLESQKDRDNWALGVKNQVGTL